MSVRRLTEHQTDELRSIYHLSDPDKIVPKALELTRIELESFLKAHGFRHQHEEVEL